MMVYSGPFSIDLGNVSAVHLAWAQYFGNAHLASTEMFQKFNILNHVLIIQYFKVIDHSEVIGNTIF